MYAETRRSWQGRWRESLRVQWDKGETPGRHSTSRLGKVGWVRWAGSGAGKHASAPVPPLQKPLLCCVISVAPGTPAGLRAGRRGSFLSSPGASAGNLDSRGRDGVEKNQSKGAPPEPLTPQGTGASTLRHSQWASQPKSGLWRAEVVKKKKKNKNKTLVHTHSQSPQKHSSKDG